MAYVWVAIGSALGGIARFGLTRLTLNFSNHFPWGTIAINVLGCFVMGFFGTLTLSTGRFATQENVRLFVLVGLCGGFTTFSSFSLHTFDMARTGDWLRAAANVTVSVGLCLLSVALGHMFAGQAVGHPPVIETSVEKVTG